MPEVKIPSPPRSLNGLAAACLVVGNPLVGLAWLWLWGAVDLFCWSPWQAFKYLACLMFLTGLFPLVACLREGLRLLRLVRSGPAKYLWLRECQVHPTRKGVWLGQFESAQGKLERLPLSHADWQPGQIYGLLSDPRWPEESVAWDDLPVKLQVGAKGRIGLKQQATRLVLLVYLAVAVTGAILAWGQIAR